MTTLAEHIIVAGAENRPQMCEESMYDSWASPQQLQDDCDVQATNIILHGLLPDVYALVNHQEAANDIWDKVKLLMKGTELSYQEHECRFFVVIGNKGIATTSRGNFAVGQARVMKCYNYLREGHMVKQCTQPKRPINYAWFKEKLMLAEAQEAGQILDEEQIVFISEPRIEEASISQQTIPQNSAFQTEDLDAYDLNCDNISSAKVDLMKNLTSCDSYVLFEVPYFDTYPDDMINQDVQEMPYSEQTHIVDFSNNEITSDSNIIPYSQYLQES
ncbi:hypothetical protein Tco_0726016 [Tanacetum coccineum]|uniref:Uncharacterized protein n=1 Tax=Tanacetum coccineum TaxID=301880 RepID=A0ABQ4YGQ4_9ASTR